MAIMRAPGFTWTLLAIFIAVVRPVSAARFSRGDVNVDGERDISDAIVSLGFLFLGDPSRIACRDAADCDDSGELDISDAIYLLAALFVGGEPLGPPLDCGDDPTPDPLDCAAFQRCPDIDVFALISCDFPEDGSMIEADPGSSIELRGRVESTETLEGVQVNGVQVELAPDGSFGRSIEVGYGVNFVELRARTASGTEYARTCTFLAAARYEPEDAPLDGAVILALKQAAVDDGDRGDLDSLGDLIGRILASEAISETIDGQLTASNPLKDSCDARDPIFGSCLLRSRVDYRGGFRFSSPTVSVTATTNRLNVELSLSNVEIPLALSGTFSSDGTVTVVSLTASASFGISVSDGHFQTTVDDSSVTIQVGTVNTDFSGLTGAIIDIVSSLANGEIRNAVSSAVRDFIRSDIPDILTSVLESLDLSSFGDRLELPALDGRDIVSVDFELAPSRAEITSSGVALGLAAGFLPEGGHSRSSLGVALASGSTWRVPGTTRPAAAGVIAGFFNHALHALWRGGALDGRFDGTQLGDGFPPGVQIVTAAGLPPVVDIRPDGTVLLMLGGLDLQVEIPGVFDEAIPLRAGAILEAPVALADGALSFGTAQIQRLELSAPSGPLSAASVDALEALLSALVSQSANELLQAALPAFPLPTFTLPESVESYGLPAGAKLGLSDSQLRVLSAQLVLDGRFGVLE